ncbi:MAG: LamG-like jellyroll fold domain-containing protein, partial [Planctomycetota bacterium]
MLALISSSALWSRAGQAAENFFPSFADEHTAGLWLFDETDYPYTTLTDAGEHEYDLRLMKDGKLVPGKFGNALRARPGRDYVVSYAAWKGAVGAYHMREPNGRPGSGLWGPTVAPEKILAALAWSDWTCEFWLKLKRSPKDEVAIIDLGDKYEPGFFLNLAPKAAHFKINNAYAGFEATCPITGESLSDKRWHHLAFTFCASAGQVSHFLDGRLQKPGETAAVDTVRVPASVSPGSLAHTTYGIFTKESSLETRRQNRFNFAIGHDRHGDKDLDALLDELRFSDTIRYCSDFEAPASFSRNYGAGAGRPAAPTGPPLLFPDGKASEPVQLGSRKHLFIDDILVGKKSNVWLSVNPPADPQQLNEDGCHDTSFFDHNGRIYMVLSDGYESDEGKI